MSDLADASIDTFAAEFGRRAVSYRDEPFVLRSGRASHYFIDTYLGLCSVSSLEQAGRLMFEAAQSRGLEFDVIAGMGLGGQEMMGALYLALIGTKRSVKFSIVRNDRTDAQGHDTGMHGAPVKDKKVWVVDNVGSSGSSLIETVDVVRAEGGLVEEADILIDRSMGRVAVALNKMKVIVHPLLQFNETTGLVTPMNHNTVT